MLAPHRPLAAKLFRLLATTAAGPKKYAATGAAPAACSTIPRAARRPPPRRPARYARPAPRAPSLLGLVRLLGFFRGHLSGWIFVIARLAGLVRLLLGPGRRHTATTAVA